MAATTSEDTRQTLELATFAIGEALCGIDILQIQEINKIMQRTTVPQAPDCVLGVLNLRGKIVTIIDLAKKLGLGNTESTKESRNIIINSFDGTAGFLVSRIGDVVSVSLDHKERPPANMQGIQGKFFAGVFTTDTQLIGMLAIDKVLQADE